jgi:hypothetical protein
MKMRFWLLVLLWCCSGLALAHSTSDTYMKLELNQSKLTGFWDVALRDLDFVLKLDGDGNRSLDTSELEAGKLKILKYVLSRLEVRSEISECQIKASDFVPTETSKGAYISIGLSVNCLTPPKTLEVTQRLFLDGSQTGQHRGFLNLVADGQEFTGVFTPNDITERFNIAAPNFFKQFLEFVWQGITHIWQGLDHILFLISLLLPAVLRRKDGRWQAVLSFQEAFGSVLKVVTAFTLAHSITLALSALEVVRLPSRLVESTIAASVILAALNNVFPIVQERRRWLVAFAFGLIHGFGFSSVLNALVLDKRALISSLLGFNVGVEIGQLAIVVAFLPLAFAIRGSLVYKRGFFALGSLLVAAVATVWLAERLFDFKILPI